MGAEPLKSNNLAPVFSFYITGFTFENKPRPALFLLPVVCTVWHIFMRNNVENCQLKIVLMTAALTPVADDWHVLPVLTVMMNAPRNVWTVD